MTYGKDGFVQYVYKGEIQQLFTVIAKNAVSWRKIERQEQYLYQPVTVSDNAAFYKGSV